MKLCGVCGLSISAFLCAVFAAGCAPRAALLSPSAVAEMKLIGAVVVRSDSVPARRANIVWTRFAANGGTPRDAVDIKTPLGTTISRLEIDADGMQIFIDGKSADVGDGSPVLRRWLEILPPPHSLGYWLVGESDPDYSAREVLIPGASAIARIYQHEWEVEFAERDDSGRPSRIKMRPQLSPPDFPGAEAEVRIREWLAP